MSANIGLRIPIASARGSVFIVVTPTEANGFMIEVTNALGHPVPDAERKRALAFLLGAVSELRSQVWRELGHKIPENTSER